MNADDKKWIEKLVGKVVDRLVAALDRLTDATNGVAASLDDHRRAASGYEIDD